MAKIGSNAYLCPANNRTTMEEEIKDEEVRISPRTGLPMRKWERKPKIDGRINNGGKRKGAGRKKLDDCVKKVAHSYTLQRNTIQRIAIMAMDYDMSNSEYIDTIVAEQWAKRKQ